MSRMVKKLPSDLDIFSSSTFTKPLCIQTLDEGLAGRALALRDLVLVVREDAGPRRRRGCRGARRGACIDIAEHSMCQPGPARCPRVTPRTARPASRLPQREVQRVVLASRRPRRARRRAGRRALARELAVVREARAREKYTSPSRPRRRGPCRSALDHRDDLAECAASRAARRRAAAFRAPRASSCR